LQADEIVIRVNELQGAVIQACGAGPQCQPGSLPTATARQIVQGMIDLRTVLKSLPDGWQASVRATWAQVKPRFAGITNPVILSAFAAVDALLGGIQ